MRNPILLNVPEEFFTERLHIRMPRPGDGKLVHEAICASQEELKQWLSFASKNQSVEDVEIITREAHSKFLLREHLRFFVFQKNTRTFIATISLHNADWEVPKFEIGYWVDSRYSGQGYISEAVRGLTEFAFNQLGANRLTIRCDPRNVKSKAVAERAGFQLEGILKNDEWSIDGTVLTDTCIYANIRERSGANGID
ncbi:acetyltransferase, GNAT family [Bacillus sp. JCM 19046]|nr:acetyltransferase, GNAT family [Bacillus sp. JCM 19045]GAF19936.1 acetyltransferase, GNAT family [Bacillus sp. JCM 19046]